VTLSNTLTGFSAGDTDRSARLGVHGEQYRRAERQRLDRDRQRWGNGHADDERPRLGTPSLVTNDGFGGSSVMLSPRRLTAASLATSASASVAASASATPPSPPPGRRPPYSLSPNPASVFDNAGQLIFTVTRSIRADRRSSRAHCGGPGLYHDGDYIALNGDE